MRSIEAAYADPAYQENARRLNATLALAHVRQASVGEPALENTHPFVYGRWVFAHNGTLQKFEERKQLLLDATPADLRGQIGGCTDSEHIFYYWLGQLRRTVKELNGPVSVHAVVESLVSTIRQLALWFPSCDGEETKLNFLLTNGSLLAATRWQHSLHLLERSQDDVEGKPNRSILIASEPTSEGDWREVADRSLVIVDDKLHLQTAEI